jgi:acyl-CoA thioesterase FadM
MCDTSQGLLFSSDDPHKQALKDLWSGNCVMRTNRAKLLLMHEEYRDWNDVLVWPLLQHVGKTSWTCGFRITDSSGSKVMALVETTMVATDDTFTESRPISSESKSGMISLMQKQQQEDVGLGRPLFGARSVDDDVPFRYQRNVRVTDCDKLNHVNNAIDGVLAEETRLYAASLCKYGSEDSQRASLQASECQISYVGQAHPFETMDIVTWSCPRSMHRSSSSSRTSSDGTRGTETGGRESEGSSTEGTDFRTDFFVNGEIVAQTTLTVLNDQRDKEPTTQQKL